MIDIIFACGCRERMVFGVDGNAYEEERLLIVR